MGIRTGVKTGENLEREMNGNGTGTGVPLNGPFLARTILACQR